MGKGLKEATAKAGKGRGTEKEHQRSSWERSPVQGVPLLVKRLSPGQSPGVRQEPWRWGSLFIAPAPAHTEAPHPPHPRAHTRWPSSVSVICVLSCVCGVYHVSEALCL